MRSVAFNSLALALTCALALTVSGCSSGSQDTEEGSAAAEPAAPASLPTADAGATETVAEPEASAAPDAFLEGALLALARGCQPSEGLAAARDAYTPSLNWNDGEKRWEGVLKEPEGGGAISPVLGRAALEIHDADGYWSLSVPVLNGGARGLQVSELVWSTGLENGINVFQMRFPYLLEDVKSRLAENGVALVEGDFTSPVLAASSDGLSTVLVCDESV